MEGLCDPQMGAGQEDRLLQVILWRAGNETTGFPLDGWRERGSALRSWLACGFSRNACYHFVPFHFISSLFYLSYVLQPHVTLNSNFSLLLFLVFRLIDMFFSKNYPRINSNIFLEMTL